MEEEYIFLSADLDGDDEHVHRECVDSLNEFFNDYVSGDSERVDGYFKIFVASITTTPLAGHLIIHLADIIKCHGNIDMVGNHERKISVMKTFVSCNANITNIFELPPIYRFIKAYYMLNR